MNYKIGDRVKVVAKKHGHWFEIGVVVTVIEVRQDVGDYTCSNGVDFWFLRDYELEPEYNIPRNIKKLNFIKHIKK